MLRPLALVMTASLLVATGPQSPGPAVNLRVVTSPPPTGGNAYFDALNARPDRLLSYTFRTQAQIDQYKASKNLGYVTYDAAMDAMRVSIPVIRATSAAPLLNAATATDTVLTLNRTGWDSAVIDKGLVKIDDEVMLVASVDTTAKTATIQTRGFLGTTAAPHAAGALVYPGTNSLQNQVRVPLGLTDGHVYVATWDVWWDHSWVLSHTGMKNFQFSSGSTDQIWLEVQLNDVARYSVGFDVNTMPGGVTMRSYNQLGGVADWSQTDGDHLGPIVTKADIVQPNVGVFLIKPDRWIRYWVVIDQRANDYDYVSEYAADFETGPNLIYSQIPTSVRKTGAFPNQIQKWWVEFNTSQDRFVRVDSRDLVAFVRNLVVIRDPASVPALLVKPQG